MDHVEVKLTINLIVHFMASNIDKRKTGQFYQGWRKFLEEDDTEIDGIMKRFITAQPHWNWSWASTFIILFAGRGVSYFLDLESFPAQVLPL